MDNSGWHAQRHAYEEQLAQRNHHRTESGHYYPVEQVGPMPESSIGGSCYTKLVSHIKTHQQMTPDQLAHMTPSERSSYYRIACMDPPLQFMCGPLLKYDTVVDHVWYGAALIVTADSGSTYSSAPVLTYEWDQNRPSHDVTQLERIMSGASFDLGPHPADPHATSPPMDIIDDHARNEAVGKPNGRRKQVKGEDIHVYADQNGSFTFWRFFLEVLLGDNGQEVTYHINNGQRMHFHVPGRNQNMRWAAYSCNGFSVGVDPDEFRGPGFRSGHDPLWVDLLKKHAQDPFHVLVGGGDQLYCDRLMYEPEMQDWLALKPEEKKAYPLTEQITNALDRFLFHHYCQHFRHGAFARANCSIPMLNMCDDHDIIDGFGSYPDDLQRAPVFQAIGVRGYFYFLLFQHFVNVTIDGTDDRPGQHMLKSLIIGDRGPYVQSPSHSLLSYLGPQCYMLLLDCRAERTLNQICSSVEYNNVFSRLLQLPPQVEHLIVQLGIPIAYPRMVFLEAALSSKLNPLVILGKAGHLGSIGLSGFVNRFNADAELLDDLNDHWTARTHKQERNWFVERLQTIARAQRLRISFLSGDVHCAAVGVFKTLKPKHGVEIPIANDYRYMVNIISSAIVNAPPPIPVLAMVSSLATKTHKALHHIETDETMLPLFVDDTNGSQRKQKYIMGKRNWCQVDWDPHTGDLVFDLRVEQVKGIGNTVGYATRVPPPNWPRA